MQLADGRALFQDIDDNLARGHQSRVELLLFRAVRSHSGDERPRSNILALQEEAPGGRAGHADVALPDSLPQLADRAHSDAQLVRELAGRLLGLLGVNVVRMDPLETPHASERSELHPALVAAAADRGHRRIRP